MDYIYQPKGAAREYCEWALNIYTGCPHACFYCYCPKILHRTPEDFFHNVAPRKNIVYGVKKQLEKQNITGKTIHLCFVGDPYPTGYDTTPTREIIKLLKKYGNHVQILTKGDGSRDFDLLDENDWYGITLDGITKRPEIGVGGLYEAKTRGIKTWISFEPVCNEKTVLALLNFAGVSGCADRVKIGKLNYFPSTINWKKFGQDAEALCRSLGLEYYIKESLREEMGR